MSERKSKYKAKVDAGKQMYGPGCCSHKLTMQRMDAIRKENGTLGRPGNPIGTSRV